MDAFATPALATCVRSSKHVVARMDVMDTHVGFQIPSQDETTPPQLSQSRSNRDRTRRGMEGSVPRILDGEGKDGAGASGGGTCAVEESYGEDRRPRRAGEWAKKGGMDRWDVGDR